MKKILVFIIIVSALMFGYRFVTKSIIRFDSDGSSFGKYSLLENIEIGGYNVYFRNRGNTHCDYFRPVDIVYDLYYTDTIRYGYNAYLDPENTSGGCYSELYIDHFFVTYSLSDAFEKGILTLSDFETADLSSITIREQPLFGSPDPELFGTGIQFGSILTNYQDHDTDLDLYYYDFTGYTCTYDVPFIGTYYSDEGDTYTYAIDTGTNCGSDMYIIYENRTYTLRSALHLGYITQSEYDEVFLERDSLVVVYPDISLLNSTVEVYTSQDKTELILTNTNTHLFIRDIINNSYGVRNLTASTRDSLLNFYDAFHTETNQTYYIEVTLEDNTVLEFILQNNILYDINEDMYIIKGAAHFTVSDYFHYRLDNEEVMSDFEDYIISD